MLSLPGCLVESLRKGFMELTAYSKLNPCLLACRNGSEC